MMRSKLEYILNDLEIQSYRKNDEGRGISIWNNTRTLLLAPTDSGA